MLFINVAVFAGAAFKGDFKERVAPDQCLYVQAALT